MVAAQPGDRDDPGKARQDRWKILLFRLEGALVPDRKFLVRPPSDRAQDLLSRRPSDGIVETIVYQPDKGKRRRGHRVSDGSGAACGVPAQDAVRRQPDTGEMVPALCEADPGSGNLIDLRAAIGIENPFRLAEVTGESLAVVAMADDMVSR